MALVMTGIKTLNKLGHNNCSILIRDGSSSGKSVLHLHYNIIPGGLITDITVDSEKREVLSEGKEAIVAKELITTLQLIH